MLFFRCASCILLFRVLVSLSPAATAPSWWFEPSTRIIEQGAPVHDFSPVTLGQLKYVATQANKYLDLKLANADGSGSQIDNVCQFTQSNNYAPATLGQLKYVAKPFYDRLASIKYNWNFPGTYGVPNPLYPWSVTTGSVNAAPATIGQLKYLFAFELSPSFLSQDTDSDGLPDWHEPLVGANPTSADSDGDSIRDGDEVAQASNPIDANNHPVALASIYRSLEYTHDLLDPSTRWRSTSASWDPALGAYTPEGSTRRAFSTLSSLLSSAIAFPTTIPPLRDLRLSTSPIVARAFSNVYKVLPDNFHYAGIAHSRIWLTVQPARALPTSRTFIKLRQQAINTGAPVLLSAEAITLTIPPNSTNSDPIDLLPSALDYAGSSTLWAAEVTESLLPVEMKVTDFATLSDPTPYVATTNATPPKNSELCLKADKTTEKAKLAIELPGITDTTMLSQLKWRVVKKPAGTLVSEGVFGGVTSPSAELSLGSGSSVEDEILFEVQVGAVGTSFTPAAKMNVRVVRDRLNWWFEPFSSDFSWRTARPEPRADTGDYPAHKANAYKRESLQSVYEFFKSSTAIGLSTPKANWAKSSITCFGEFHDALKTANGNNPLVDLTSLSRIDMTAVTELASFDLKYGALRSALGKQTTYPSDANPTLRATQFSERVQFATAAAAAVGDANLTRARLMALWTREGSMDVSSQHTRTGYNPWPIGFGAAVSAAPASEADAKAIFIYDVAYICLGSDFLLKHSGGADNEPDLRDYPAALTHFKSTADATGGAGIGDRIVSNLSVVGSAGSYTVSANGAFYEDMLTLAGKHFVSVWQTEGPDATYMAYNMGVAKFNQMKATIGNASYPERGRLGLMDWAIHYEIRSGEWDQPRDFAQKFHAYRMAFEVKYP